MNKPQLSRPFYEYFFSLLLGFHMSNRRTSICKVFPQAPDFINFCTKKNKHPLAYPYNLTNNN